MKEGRLPTQVTLLFGAAMVWGLFWPGNIALSLDSMNYQTREIRITTAYVTDLQLGEFYQFEVICLEDGQAVTTCTPHWESSDERVAIVSRTGEMVLVGEGHAFITVSWSLNDKAINNQVAIEIQVPEPPPPPRRPLVGVKMTTNHPQRGPIGPLSHTTV